MTQKNPLYEKMTQREKDLMSVGRPVQCPACRETSFLYPKAVGHHPYEWEMNCKLCHHYAVGLNAYEQDHSERIKTLEALRSRYLAGETSQALESEVNRLADENDAVLLNRLCDCGGTLSIAEKPKCIYCDVEILDSYFHVADQPVGS